MVFLYTISLKYFCSAFLGKKIKRQKLFLCIFLNFHVKLLPAPQMSKAYSII